MSDTDAARIGDVKKGFEAVAGSVSGLMRRDGANVEMSEAQAAAFRANLGLGAGGAAGANGWTPILATVADGERMVQLVQDWVGGTGAKPQAGLYIGATGLVATAAEAVDVRGGEGRPGTPGAPGGPGTPGGDGDDGTDGWTPIEANIVDGERRVKRIVDWVGGTGTKPVTGKYVGATGLVDTAAEATDVRGPGGFGSGDMKGANNLSDLADPEMGRVNLGVYSTAESDDLIPGFATVAEVWAGTVADKIVPPSVLTAAMVPQALPSTSGSIAVDCSTGINFKVAATGNITLANPTNKKDGRTFYIRVALPNAATTTSRGSEWKLGPGSPPIPTAANSRFDLICSPSDTDVQFNVVVLA